MTTHTIQNVKLYHGSSNFNPIGGYAGGKARNFQYGVGLYCTNSYEWASMYGRRTYVLDVVLDSSKCSDNVEIPITELQHWLNAFGTKKLAKIFKEEFQYRDTLSGSRFEVFLLWHIKSLTKLAVPLANFFAHNGITHSNESGQWNGRLIRIFDFDIITHSTYDKEVLKELNYDTLELAY